jgi:tetratricopeptide (TPR) repeat protein
LRLGRNSDAAKLLEPAFEAHPDDRTIDYALATALIRDGRLREGKLVIDRISKNGNAAQARLLTGAAQLSAGESAKAVTMIHQALAQNSRLPGGWAWYGQALMESGDNENAKKAFARAIQADTHDFEANLDFGRLLRLESDNVAAEPYLERSLRLRPDSLSARFQVGALNLALGRLDEAERELERVARDSPDFQEVHEQLAALYDRMHRPQDGERERQIALRLGERAGPHTFQPEP